jgi:hypothetical protein
MFNDFQDKVKLINYNIQIWKYHIKEPGIGTLWYWVIRSRSYFRLRIFIYLIGLILILFLFSIYRFIKEHESLIVFIYIIWFFSSLFYIEFIIV